MAHTYALYDKPHYLRDLTRRLDSLGRGDRADLACMTFEPRHEVIGHLATALTQAAARGVNVHLLYDAINFMTADDGSWGPLFKGGSLEPDRVNPTFRPLATSLHAMREAGVRLTMTNRPRHRFSLPIAGRSHMKFAVLNDRVYLGGCNLDYPDHLDAMAAWQDAATADWLHKLARRIHTSGTVVDALGDIDLQHELDPTSRILLDVGKRGQSVVLDQALTLIDQAERHIYLSTQYFPSRATSQHLKRALARGVEVRMVYNHHRNIHRAQWLHRLNLAVQRRSLPAALFTHGLPEGHPYVHAKILATDKGCLFGSHNYVKPGVSLGTAEIALLSTNAAFGRGLVKWFDEVLAKAR